MTVLSFKVKVENGNLHRFGLRKPTLSTLLEALSNLGLPSDLQLSYMDEFEDEVTFFTDFEFEELARIHHDKVVRLFAKPKRVSSPAVLIINPIPSTNALSTASSSASTNTLPAVTATTSTTVDIKPRKVGKASSDAKVEFKPKRQTFAAFRAKLNSVNNDLAERERIDQEHLEREIEIEKLKFLDFSYARMLDKMEKMALENPALTSALPDVPAFNNNITNNNNNNNALGATTTTPTVSTAAPSTKQGVVAAMVSKIDQIHSQSATLSLSPPSARLALRARLEMRKWSASFIEDATLIDGPRPAGTHRKTWVVRNDGVNTWDGVRIVYIGGKGGKSIGFGSAPVPLTKPCEIAVVSVDVVVPPEPGRYIAFFKLNNPRGKRFGPRLWVEVTVAPNSDTPLSLESTIQTARNRGFKQPKHILEDLHAIHNGDIDKIVAELSIINDASSSTRSGGVNYWIGRKAFAMEESPGCATAQTALSSRREIASKVFGTSLVTPRLLDDNRGDLVKTIESLSKYRADSESSASAEAGRGDNASSSGEYETEEEEEEEVVVEEKASTNDMEEANKILRANAAAMAFAIPSTPTKTGHNRKSSWEML